MFIPLVIYSCHDPNGVPYLGLLGCIWEVVASGTKGSAGTRDHTRNDALSAAGEDLQPLLRSPSYSFLSGWPKTPGNCEF